MFLGVLRWPTPNLRSETFFPQKLQNLRPQSYAIHGLLFENEKPPHPHLVVTVWLLCYPFLLEPDFPLFIGSVCEAEYWPNSRGEICTLNNANGSISERFYRQSFELTKVWLGLFRALVPFFLGLLWVLISRKNDDFGLIVSEARNLYIALWLQFP